MFNKRKFGAAGERLAKEYFLSKDYIIIAQNFWTRCGEIDLIVQKNEQIFLVEVKTRRSDFYGWAEETISPKKIQNIVRSYYILQKIKYLSDYTGLIICVIEISGCQAKIRLFEI